MLTKPAALWNKSAECKCSQSRFQHTTDHPLQLLVQSDRCEPPKKFLLKCIGAFWVSLFSASHSFTKDLFVVFLTNNSIIVNCSIITGFMDWDLPGYLLCCCTGEVVSFFYVPLREWSQKQTPMLRTVHPLESSRNAATALPKRC